jgi:hypothetical protein
VRTDFVIQVTAARRSGSARSGAMTSPDVPVPDDDQPPDAGPPQPEGAPGAELGAGDGSGGTFEPEEDPDTEG